ncbi:MAG: N-acetylneuraminate synthase family protein [Bacteroidota bacterium]
MDRIPTVPLGDRLVGDGQPIYIIAEIGINHNGSLDLAKQLIDAAKEAGCDAVKFQKRTPELCVPPEQRSKMRQTPWGYITYFEYREQVEFGWDEYEQIDAYCKGLGIQWLASCWDEESVKFIEAFDSPAYKIQSAAVTDGPLLEALKDTGRPLVLSTGMSTMEQIHEAVDFLGMDDLVLCHSTSSYPCPPDEINLRMIDTLRATFPYPVGYSGHEVGLPTTVASAAMGACYIERHITLDRAMWGSDQAASVEPGGFKRLVHYIRTVETAMGDGQKRVYESELSSMKKLRRFDRVTDGMTS